MRREVTTVVYHHIAEHEDPLKYFVRHFDIVSGSDVVSGTLPRKPLLITFDDAYRSVLDTASTILKTANGPEPTNDPYAIAKIAGIKMVEAYRNQYGSDFINVMPTNLCGPGDNYHPEYSHVVAALIRRFHEAKVSGAKNVVVWGTGTPRREFVYLDDLADACVQLMKTYSSDELVNDTGG